MVWSDAEVYQKHTEDLIRYATVLVCPDLAEDVLSTVLVRVLDLCGFGRIEAARPYLFRAVLNEARSILRRRRTVELPDVSADLAAGDVELFDAVLRLPSRQRAEIYLMYWEGLRIAEIAQMMRIAPGTSKRYLHLARRRLRGLL